MEPPQSSNPIARAEALRAALSDENVGIRSNALFLVLRRRESLPVAITLQPGAQVYASDIPVVDVNRIAWDADQKSFRGLAHSRGHSSAASGSVTDGALMIRYIKLGISSVFDEPASGRRSRGPTSFFDCSVTLALEPGQNALTGKLRCEGLPQSFLTRMPLG